MRILANTPTNKTRKTSKNARLNGQGAVFSLGASAPLAQSAPAARTAPANPIGDISSLLAVQSVDVDEKGSAAISRGFDTLDALDALKIDVLSGQFSRQRLVHLGNLVSSERAGISDPALISILDHIELRARVELAKFDKSRT